MRTLKRQRLIPAAISALTAAFVLTGCNPTPELTGLSPSSGAEKGGETVTISGDKFKEGLQVSFGGKNVTPTSVTKTAITLTAPAGDVGEVTVEVTNPKDKPAETTLKYTYKDTTAPSLTSLTPSDGQALAQGSDYEDAVMTGVRQITAVFDEPLASGSIAVSYASHDNALNASHTGEVEGETKVEGSSVSFTAASDLISSRKYMVTVMAADSSGNDAAQATGTFTIEPPERLRRYTVQEGDTLQSIAARPDTYDDSEEWRKIAIVNLEHHELNVQQPQAGLRLLLHWGK